MARELRLDDVEAARTAIGGRLHRTPTFSSATLGERTGTRAFLKAELFQRTGSFKPRGVLTKLASLSAGEKAQGVISISAGNHAQALAYGAALERVDCLVVMWQGVNPLKLEATRGYGARVDLEATGPREAFERLAELIAQTGRTLVHPFDDLLTMAGQGTVGLELLEDVPDADVVVVPVGGGGLVSGMATAVKGRRPAARVVAVEPQGSAALHEALAAERIVQIEPRTAADGLNAPFAGELCLEVCKRLLDASVLVTDEEIEDGMRFLYGRAKLACEPAGAAATGALLAGKIELRPGETVVAVVSGGNVAGQIASGILSPDEGWNPS
jgi:threonine dehydratase